MHQCVLGVLFDPTFQHIALLQKKTGPLCLINKWNFPGGKAEKGESIRAAVRREFGEETGLWLPSKSWTKLASFTGPLGDDWCDQFKVTAFWATSPDIHTVKTTTREPVAVFRLDTLPSPLAPQLPWLIEMAKDPTVRKREWRISQ